MDEFAQFMVNKKNKLLNLIPALGLLLLFSYYPAQAVNLDNSVLKTYPSALTLPQKRLEFSLDYLIINDTIDIFDVRDDEISTTGSLNSFISLGDMKGCQVQLNYGVLEKTTLQAGFIYRDLDYGFDNIEIQGYDISFKQSLINQAGNRIPFLALDAGVRFNNAADLIYDEDNEINLMIGKFSSSGIRVRTDNSYVWFDKISNGTTASYGVLKNGRPGLKFTIEDMSDITPFIRLTAGKRYGIFSPNLFLEYGYTSIDSKLDSNVKDYLPEEISDKIPQLPIDLSRHENFLKAGFGFRADFPFKTTAMVEYNYIKLFRDSNLDYVDYNHVLKAEINYAVSRCLFLNIGGVYYYRQFNGIMPFLYNEYSQTSFDHQYGRAHIGFTLLFGGN
ncbi:MAG: hypothetical protein JW786_15130 [Desulfobacterales bacterium]|nr:hypothetical protein [Desulfobacterales bacterium]